MLAAAAAFRAQTVTIMAETFSFGNWIRQRRRALDLTQDELANRVGCSLSAIRKIEADERRPSRQVAELLADTLQIPGADRATFLKVARMELGFDRLNTITAPAAQTPVVLPPAGDHARAILQRRHTATSHSSQSAPPHDPTGRARS